MTGTYNNNVVAEVKLERQNGQELEGTYTFVTCKVDTDTLSDYQTGKHIHLRIKATAKNDKGSIEMQVRNSSGRNNEAVRRKSN